MKRDLSNKKELVNYRIEKDAQDVLAFAEKFIQTAEEKLAQDDMKK
jgi:capsule polysaccharide export protein KpsE/RkpR